MTSHATPAPPPIGWPLLPLPDEGGELRYPTLEESVRQQIRVILTTRPGEQLMRPEYGAGLDDYVHEPNTLATRRRIRDAVAGSLARWEPRIDVDDVIVSFDARDQTVLYIEIRYAIRRTNDRRNLVFPFYVIPGGD